MKTIVISIGLLVLTCGLVFAQTTGDQAELDRVIEQINAIIAQGGDVPIELDERYFELYNELYPVDTRGGGALDQGSGGCVGAVMFTQPEAGVDTFFFDSGTTNARGDSCTYLSCGRGPDVFFKLLMTRRDRVTIDLCTSAFDTRLCVFRESDDLEGGECCNPAFKYAENDDNDECPVGDRSKIDTCFVPGLYYIVVDGDGLSAQGSYNMRIDFANDDCIPPEPPAECPEIFAEHIEDGNEEPCGFVTQVETCPAGFCGEIFGGGDQDVYRIVAPTCESLIVSLYANATEEAPGGTGFEGGLDGELTLYTTECDAPLSYNDNIGDGGIAPSYVAADPPEGSDSQIHYTSLIPGAEYYIVVTGRNGSTGLYELVIECDDCINPD